jgi:hypothetical protein
MRRTGVEPAVPRLRVGYSYRLSFRRMNWRSGRDSNSRGLGRQSSAFASRPPLRKVLAGRAGFEPACARLRTACLRPCLANAPCYEIGSAGGTRTRNYCIHSAALWPLSYGQHGKLQYSMATVRLELTRESLKNSPLDSLHSSPASVRLHAHTRVKRCARRDSNSQRTVFKTAASYRLGYARRPV